MYKMNTIFFKTPDDNEYEFYWDAQLSDDEIVNGIKEIALNNSDSKSFEYVGFIYCESTYYKLKNK